MGDGVTSEQGIWRSGAPRVRTPEVRSRTRALPVILGATLFLLAFGGVLLVHPAAATIVVVSGDWTVVAGTSEVYDGITFKVDGDVTVETGALLEIRNGGLVFLNDVTDDHNLDIQDGGSGHGTLRLDNSILTTEPVQINVSLNLDVTVAGTLELLGGSIQKHPGTLTASGDASIEVRDSTITGFTNGEISAVTNATDFYNDAPRMTFGDTSTVVIAHSTLERLYENASAPRPDPDYDIVVESSATLTIIDSYVGVDFTPWNTTRNTIVANDSSSVYIYNVTIDEIQSFAIPVSSWESALLTSGPSAEIYIHRWLDVRVTDRFGNGVPGAYVESRTMPVGLLAVYPRNAGANTPSAELLDYVGVTAGTFNVTGPSGGIQIPLLTEWINSTTLPNSEFDGSYRIRASFGSNVSIEYVVFDGYPVLMEANNSRSLTVSLDGLVHPAQDTTYVWDSTVVIDYDVVLDGNLRVTGDVTVAGANLSILQGDAVAGRHYLIVEGSGSLTLQGAALASNLPLVVYLRDSASLQAIDSTILLSTFEGRGLLYTEDAATVEFEDLFVWSDIAIQGASASFEGVTFARGDLTFNATGTTTLWDPVFTLPPPDVNPYPEGVTLALLSDDGDVDTVDFDLRNVTLNDTLSGSVTFAGMQHGQLTNVTLDVPGDWWEGRIADQAKVGLYYWFSVEAVDAAGTAIQDANITLQQFNPDTLLFETIAAPGPEDLYGGTWTAGHAESPEGSILYRALSQERREAQGWSNATYRANGSKVVDATTFYADANVTVVVFFDVEASLIFTDLTPEVSVSDVSFAGANGGSATQPEDLSVALQAQVQNDAKVAATDVTIHYYEVDVDTDDDGAMDAEAEAYAPFLLGTVVATVPAQDTYEAVLPWTPTAGTYALSVVVDPFGTTAERNESNNVAEAGLEVVTWPDLSVSPSDISLSRTPVNESVVTVQVQVHNLRSRAATGALVELYDNGNNVSFTTAAVPGDGTASVLLPWTSTPAGTHTLMVRVVTLNDTAGNTDFNSGNNQASMATDVRTKPDLEVRASDYNTTIVVEGEASTVSVVVYNVGDSDANDVEVALYLDAVEAENLLDLRQDLSVPAGENLTLEMTVAGQAAGNYTLFVVADPSETLPEVDEDNNQASFTLEVVPPEGQVYISTPETGAAFNLGDTIFVAGSVTTPTGKPIPGMPLTVVLRDAEDNFHDPRSIQTDASGEFAVGISVPEDGPSGEWTLSVASGVESIQGSSLRIGVDQEVPWYKMVIPLVNLPLWMVLAGLASVLLLIFAVAGYMKTVGLGRLVECGECGAFISEGAASCPKCGTEFEREMAKCSSCHAWIPLDVKQCPECGVTFTSGKVKGKDRQETMRRQYEKVVSKYRAEAARSLGRTPSEKEFQEWWRRQPTYVTFDQWRKEEEEMRKMGSKACSQCGALNSVTAKVCHSCGKLLGGKGGGGSVGRPPATPPGGAPQAKPSEGRKPVLKKVLKKPFKKRKQAQ